MNDTFNWENLAKRLMGAMAIGVHLESDSGHIWICSSDDEDFFFGPKITAHGVAVNNKIYGGILEALNVIDKALVMCGERTLIEQWDDERMFLGEDTYDCSRIDRYNDGEGGLY